METNNPQAGRISTLLWIILSVAVLLIAGFGLYSRLGLKRQPPVTLPAVVRVKIPSTMNTPMATFTDKTSIQPQNGQDNSGAAVAGNNNPEVSSLQPVNAAPDDRQMIADRAEPDNIMPSSGVNAPSGARENAIDKSQLSESEDNQTPSPETSSSKPMAAADEQKTIGSLASDGGQAADPATPQPTSAQQVQAAPGSGSNATQDPKRQGDDDQSAPFTIQVGAYLTKAYADQAVTQLIEKGYDAYIFQRTDKKQRVWNLVRFGHFKDRAAASQILATFQDQERMAASIAVTKVQGRN